MLKQLLISSLLLLSAGTAHAADRLTVVDPWVREAPPSTRVIGAFMTLKNHSDQAIVLKVVSSPIAARMEIHRTVMEGGMARMVEQHELSIPAHGELVLKPGSYHLMLFGLKHVPVKGEKVSITLTFADGSSQDIIAVTKPFMGQAHQHDHSHHQHMQH